MSGLIGWGLLILTPALLAALGLLLAAKLARPIRVLIAWLVSVSLPAFFGWTAYRSAGTFFVLVSVVSAIAAMATILTIEWRKKHS